MHSGGSYQTTNILVYIQNTNTSWCIAEKKWKGSVKVVTTIYIYIQLILALPFTFTFLYAFSSLTSSSTIGDWAYLGGAWQCSYSSRKIWISEFLLLLLDSMYNKSKNISPIYRTWLHSLGTRSAVDLKRYYNISQVYRGWLHSLGIWSFKGVHH